MYLLKPIFSNSSADFLWAWLLEIAGNQVESITFDVVFPDYMLRLVSKKKKKEQKLFK